MYTWGGGGYTIKRTRVIAEVKLFRQPNWKEGADRETTAAQGHYGRARLPPSFGGLEPPAGVIRKHQGLTQEVCEVHC